jgi:hypothetical protein
MPTFTNPYNYVSPIGEALGNLGKTLMSGPSEAERIKAAEEALKLKNTRVNTQSVADLFRQGAGAYKANQDAINAAAIAAGMDPSNVGGFERLGASTAFGAADPRTDNAAVGAGGTYSSTAQAFRTDQGNQNARAAAALAENARQFNEKPYEFIGADGKPVVGTTQGAIGQTPLLDETHAKGFDLQKFFNAPGGGIGSLPEPEQRVLGAASPADKTNSPKNYKAPDGSVHVTYDGVTDAQTGASLPPGGFIATVQGGANDAGVTNATQSKVEQQNIALDQLDNLSKYTRDLVTKDPTNVGLPGFAKGVVQDVNQVADGLAQGLGFKGLDAAIQSARARAASSGVSGKIISQLFDPNLPKLRQAYALLTFTAASALANQRGQGVSDKDVERIEKMVGSPENLFSSQASLVAGLDGLDNLSAILRPSMPQANGAPAAGAPTAAPAAGSDVPPASFMPEEPTRGNIWKFVKPEDRALFQ